MSDQATISDGRNKPTDNEVREAVKTLLRYTGDDPTREGLLETPERVRKAWNEWFAGYESDPKEHLYKWFEHVGGYDEIVVLRDIRLESFCEHHIAPIVGTCHIAYLPKDKVVGLSKLARVADGFSKRLQVQERLTAQIADAIEDVLDPLGVAVLIEASHLCTATRGVHKPSSRMVTSAMRGVFRSEPSARLEVMSLFSDRK